MKRRQLTGNRAAAWRATPHRDGDLSQDVLGDAQALLDHLLVELVQGRVHQLHADPHVALATQIREEVRKGKKTKNPARMSDRRERKPAFTQVQSQTSAGSYAKISSSETEQQKYHKSQHLTASLSP